MSNYTEFFLNSKASVVELDCFEISHSSFSQTYYLVRNSTLAITVTHENATEHEYLCAPMKVTFDKLRDDLDQIINIQFGDLGEIIPIELKRVRIDDKFKEYPKVVYRTYRSDVLTEPLYGPARLELAEASLTRMGSLLKIQAPSLNTNRTGENYRIARFPMLIGLV